MTIKFSSLKDLYATPITDGAFDHILIVLKG